MPGGTSTATGAASPTGTTESTSTTAETTSTAAEKTGTTSTTAAVTSGSQPTTPPSDSATNAPTPEQIQACVAALRGAADAQAKASAGLTSAAEAVTAGQAALAAATKALAASAAAAKAAAAKAAAAAKSAAGGSAGGGTVTEAKLIVDRATVTNAEAALAKAQHYLDASTLTAPIGGVVGSVPFAAGDSATSATGFVIVGTGAARVTVQVPQANLASISIGQVGHVTVSGTTPVDGAVSAIALLPTAASTSSAAAGSSSTPTYAVELLVAGFPDSIGTGGKATVSLVTKRVDNVVTVPASAVTILATGTGAVQVVKDGAATATTVLIGALGGGKVQVVSGIAAGDTVVIGDTSQPLPTNGSIPGIGGGLGGIGGISGGNVRVPGAGGARPGG